MQQYRFTGVALQSAGSTVICPADATRKVLLVSFSLANQASIFPQATIPSTAKGIYIGTDLRVKLTLEDDGVLVTLAWWGQSTPAGAFASVFEVYDQDKPWPDKSELHETLALSYVPQPSLDLPGEHVGPDMSHELLTQLRQAAKPWSM